MSKVWMVTLLASVSVEGLYYIIFHANNEREL